MITTQEKCPDCGKKILIHIGQSFVNGDLNWYRSIYCESCGTSIEENGQMTPEYIREEILKYNGIWELHIKSDVQKILALKIIRKVLKLSFSEIKSMIAEKRSAIFTGTSIEVKWIESILKKSNISTMIKNVKKAKRIKF